MGSTKATRYLKQHTPPPPNVLLLRPWLVIITTLISSSGGGQARVIGPQWLIVMDTMCMTQWHERTRTMQPARARVPVY